MIDQIMSLKDFAEYLAQRFPNIKIASNIWHLWVVSSLAIRYGYQYTSDLDLLLMRTEVARNAINRHELIPSAAGHIARAIGLEEPYCREEERWKRSTRSLLHLYATGH